MENLPLRRADQACGPDHSNHFPSGSPGNRPVSDHPGPPPVVFVTCRSQVPVRCASDCAAGHLGQ
ncbi:hypothetical protein GCM10023237_57440 [Streptomyces coeruleoprunus]